MLYVPILKAKKGEYDGVINLKEDVKDKIIPLFEIVPEKIGNFKSEDLNTYWPGRPLFFDFSPELDWSENYSEVFKVYESIDHPEAIPTVSMDYPDEYIQRVNDEYAKVLLRFRIHELQNEDFTTRLKEISGILSRPNHYLMIDIQEIDESKLALLSFSLKTVIATLSEHFNTANLIISSGSFPAQLSPKKHEFYKIDRLEHRLWISLNKQIDSNIIYSDYTINNWRVTEYIIGMQVSFNIRYTLREEYLIYKGFTTRNKGLQMDNVRPVCEKLITMPEYSGRNFSWGDNEIYLKAMGETDRGGSSTTWRSIGINHHITLIVDLLSNPI